MIDVTEFVVISISFTIIIMKGSNYSLIVDPLYEFPCMIWQLFIRSLNYFDLVQVVFVNIVLKNLHDFIVVLF